MPNTNENENKKKLDNIESLNNIKTRIVDKAKLINFEREDKKENNERMKKLKEVAIQSKQQEIKEDNTREEGEKQDLEEVPQENIEKPLENNTQPKIEGGKEEPKEDISQEEGTQEEVKESEQALLQETPQPPLQESEGDQEGEQEEIKQNFFTRIKNMSKFQRKKVAKKIAKITSTIIIWTLGVILMFLCASNLYQHTFNQGQYVGFFGLGEAVVASESMEPSLFVNDLIFYRSVNKEDIKVGDTIVYKKNDDEGKEILVVHNVIKIKDNLITTQGINNDLPDEAFQAKNIVGKYMFKIPRGGVILHLFSSIWTPFIIIVLVVGSMVCRMFYFMWRKNKIIKAITPNENNQDAINHFFEI